MKQLEDGKFLVETLADLEEVERVCSGSKAGFLDIETTSGSTELHSKNPHRNCRPCGFAITAGTHEEFRPAYYIPVRHSANLFGNVNLNEEAVLSCLKRIMSTWSIWVNQSVKYDMHVLRNTYGWDVDICVEDLLTVAKMYDSDQFIYNLTVLSDDFRGVDIRPYEQALQPYLVKNQDYGRIDVDVMGTYACEDVIAVREIWEKINRLMDPELDHIRSIERAVTRVLYETEQNGLHLDSKALKMQRILVGHEVLLEDDQLARTIEFPGFNTNSPKNMTEYFINRLGLPVLKWTNEDDTSDNATHNPSFGKDVLTEYLVHPRAPAEIVKFIIALKKKKKFFNAFLTPYASHIVDDVAHSNYNQLIRTGRMACKEPNAQQLDKAGKKLITPRLGNSFLSIDQSQIEFRAIVHYIRDPRCMAAYKADPDTDFHTWVANIANISRKNAKTVNFLMGYGGGKEKLIQALIKDPDLVGSIKAESDALIAKGASMQQAETYFLSKARALAEGIYNSYHHTLPTLKKTSYDIAGVARNQGFVRTLYKRRRHLRSDRAHIAFNSACQGTAADFIKDSLARLHPVCKSAGVNIAAVVHDEILFEGPTPVIRSEEFLRACLSIMEKPEPLLPFRIPVRCKYGISEVSWYDAGEKPNGEKSYPLERSDWQRA